MKIIIIYDKYDMIFVNNFNVCILRLSYIII